MTSCVSSLNAMDWIEHSMSMGSSQTFQSLSAMPRIGVIRPELTGDRLRWYTVFRFAVIYDPEASPLTIMRVIHGARNLDSILCPDR